MLRDGDIVYVHPVSPGNVNPASRTNVDSVINELSATFGPYPRGTFSPTQGRSRQRRRNNSTRGTTSLRVAQINKRIIIIKNCPLPTTCKVNIKYLDGQLIFQKSDTDIRTHIIDLLQQEHQQDEFTVEDLVLLRCEGKWLSKPTLPQSFSWSGEIMAKFAGQGSLYVQLKSPTSNDSDEELPEINFSSTRQRTVVDLTTPAPAYNRLSLSQRRAAVHQSAITTSMVQPSTSTLTVSAVQPSTSMVQPSTSTLTVSAVQPSTSMVQPSTSTLTVSAVQPSSSTTNSVEPPSTTTDLTSNPFTRLNHSFMDYPTEVLDLYQDSELDDIEDDDRRDSDVVTLRTGPSVLELLHSLVPGIQNPPMLRILVRRGHVLDDALQRIRRCNPDHLKQPVQVTFVGEPGEDEGGPRREMFTLLFQEMSASKFMCCHTLSHNGELRLISLYRAIGWLMVLSLIYGGPAPRLFSPGVVRYLLDQTVQTGIEDLGMYKGGMEQLMSMTTEMLRESVDVLLPDRFNMGYTKPTSQLEITDLPMMVKVISYHVAIQSCCAELDQLKEGLSLFGFLEKARMYPGRLSDLLEVPSTATTLTTDSFMELLSIYYSDVGSNARVKEEAVVIAFNTFLLDVEAGDVTTPLSGMTMDGTSTTYQIKLADILFFTTGCLEIPPLGFPRECEPQLAFDHTRTDRLPTANTCGCILFIPMCDSNVSPEGLRENLILSVCGSPGFGKR